MSVGGFVTGSYRPYNVAQAISEIYRTYGDRVDVEGKTRGLLKFGRNTDIGTSNETIWQGSTAHETLSTTNDIDKISSSSGSDTMDIRIYGHTVSGTGADAQFTEVVQDVTLVGQTETALGTALARVNRAFVLGSTALAGDVYIYEDDTVTGGVPQTAGNIHAKLVAADNQTYKAATTTANNEYLILTSMYASVKRQTSAIADMTIEIQEPGGIFRPKTGFSVTQTGGMARFDFDSCIVVPKNSDVRVTGTSSAVSTQIDAGFQGYYAIVLG